MFVKCLFSLVERERGSINSCPARAAWNQQVRLEHFPLVELNRAESASSGVQIFSFSSLLLPWVCWDLFSLWFRPFLTRSFTWMKVSRGSKEGRSWQGWVYCEQDTLWSIPSCWGSETEEMLFSCPPRSIKLVESSWLSPLHSPTLRGAVVPGRESKKSNETPRN